MKVFVLDGTEPTVMSNKDAMDENDSGLIHLHICIHCGHARRRKDVEDREVSSGILHCPKCGLDGPLNIEVRDSPSA
jgi:predicted RNA-binding Zn-ribbon protein involved in translation (DUF1610 family)